MKGASGNCRMSISREERLLCSGSCLREASISAVTQHIVFIMWQPLELVLQGERPTGSINHPQHPHHVTSPTAREHTVNPVDKTIHKVRAI